MQNQGTVSKFYMNEETFLLPKTKEQVSFSQCTKTDLMNTTVGQIKAPKTRTPNGIQEHQEKGEVWLYKSYPTANDKLLENARYNSIQQRTEMLKKWKAKHVLHISNYLIKIIPDDN